MLQKASLVFALVVLTVFVGCDRGAEQPVQQAPPLTADDVVGGFERMCANDRASIEARQAETTLYDRVGGREGLRWVVADTVQRHLANPDIKHHFEGVDAERLVTLVTDFLVLGTGGEGEYQGRDMVEAHAHLKLTNAEFLAAAGDLREAMDSAGWGEFEHQEMVCAFFGLRRDVVAR